MFRYACLDKYYILQATEIMSQNRWYVIESASSEFKIRTLLTSPSGSEAAPHQLVLNPGSWLILQCQLCPHGLTDDFLSSCLYNLAKDRQLAVFPRWGDHYQALFCLVQTQASPFVNRSFSRGHSDHNFRPQPLSWWSFLGNWTQWERFLPLLSLWVSIFLPL